MCGYATLVVFCFSPVKHSGEHTLASSAAPYNGRDNMATGGKQNHRLSPIHSTHTTQIYSRKKERRTQDKVNLNNKKRSLSYIRNILSFFLFKKDKYEKFVSQGKGSFSFFFSFVSRKLSCRSLSAGVTNVTCSGIHIGWDFYFIFFFSPSSFVLVFFLL